MSQKIKKIAVHLVSLPVAAGLADATRKVESVGYIVVRITTDQGLEGVGLTYHEVDGEATKALILNNFVPKLIDCDPFATEVLWEQFFHYLRGVGRKGLTFGALSAVDTALWDLKGKIMGLPLFRLLGGNKTSVPVYASGGWTSYSDDQLVQEAQSMVAQGYQKIKVKLGVEGGTKPRHDIERMRKVREAIGPEIDLLVDANNC